MEFIKLKDKISLPARNTVFKTALYTETYMQSGHLEGRPVLLFVPDVPGNDHATCDVSNFSGQDHF